MKKFALCVISILAAAAIAAAQCSPPAKQTDRRHDNAQYDVAGMFKMHVNAISKDFTTGAQPTVEILKDFRDQGAKAVINLRPRHEHNAAEEEEAAKKLGLRYFNIPVEYRDPKFEQVDEFLKLTDDLANRPALIHCTMNIRAGAFFAIRRVLRDGWKFEDAEKEAAKAAPIAPHLKKFALDYIAARQKSAPRPSGDGAASAQSPPMLVSTEWLAQKIAQKAPLVLLHVGTQAGYDAAHIVGARLALTQQFVLSRDASGRSTELPPIEQLTAWVQGMGISGDSTVVVYMGATGVTSTTRLFFTLEVLGVRNLFLLDGGLPAWQAENRPVTTDLPPPAAPGNFKPRIQSSLLVDANWVKENLNNPAVSIVDSRGAGFYSGADDNQGQIPRPGHIAGAFSLPYSTLIEPSGKFKSTDELRKLFQAAGIQPQAYVVTYCHIGYQATLGYFAARMLGHKAAMYDGSYSEWNLRPDLPVEKTAASIVPSGPPK